MTQPLALHIEGNNARITLNNPPANTWTEASLRLLTRMVRELDDNREVYSLVIHSEQARFFSAGADLNLFADGDRKIAQQMALAFGEAFETLSAFRGVSIAAIDGYAMGGGLEMALACDLRVAGESAILALPEARVGLLPCAGGTQNLTRLVGESWAKRMILLGERLSAEKALQIGLIEETVEAGKALDRALELARDAARQSPQSVAACKQLIHSHRQRHWVDGHIQEREAFLKLFDGEDQQEGTQAFLQKREPQWKNR